MLTKDEIVQDDYNRILKHAIEQTKTNTLCFYFVITDNMCH